MKRLVANSLNIFFRLLYDEFAWLYDWVAGLVSVGNWNDWVESVCPYLDGQRILEIGHGSGHLQVKLRQSCPFVVGLDKSKSMGAISLRKMREAGLSALLVNSYAQFLPFVSASFGQVVATFPSEYVVDHRTLREVYRVLSPGGQFIVLPFAWITGKNFLERCAAFLFHITGQAPEWDERFAIPFTEAGFIVSVFRKEVKSSWVLIIEAKKPDGSIAPLVGAKSTLEEGWV